jgi:hypothetical protein
MLSFFIGDDAKMKDGKKKTSLRIFSFNGRKLERILIICFTICVLLLITAQFLMTNPSIRVFLTQEENAEGAFFEQSGTIYDKGILSIELIDSARLRDDAWVLVNGLKVTNFTQKQVSISVKDGDLVEIDGTKVSNAFAVKVSSYSSNAKLIIDNSSLVVNRSIGVLARVKLK